MLMMEKFIMLEILQTSICTNVYLSNSLWPTFGTVYSRTLKSERYSKFQKVRDRSGTLNF